MRTLFLLNPAAGKQDCTASLIPQIEAAARRAGLAEGEYTVCVTEYAGHARELAHAAAQETAQSGEPLRIYTAGGDGTFMEAMTGVQGFPHAAVGCLPYGSGNDFLRTYGTKEEFADLDAQLAGGKVTIDLLETNLGLSATICAAGWTHRWPTASRSSGASRCAAVRWPICSPSWSSSADTSAGSWPLPSTARS